MTGNTDIAIYAEDKRLTLYPDENINLNQAVQSLKDLTKVFTDFTRSFSVPANDNNNSIFKHYYDAQIVNGFDARVKIEGRIEIGGVTLMQGKIQLNDVSLKSNVPTDYKLEFFGNTVKIKDVIGDDTLRELDLSALDHAYTPASIKTGLTTGLFSGQIKYPLLSYDRRFLFANAQQDTEDLINIKYDDTFTSGVQWNELKPAIKLKSILEAIEAKPEYNLYFSRDFFDTQEFSELYMSLGNGSNKQNPISINNIITYDVNVFGRTTLSGSTPSFFKGQLRANVTLISGDFEYRVVFLINGDRVFESEYFYGNSNFEYDTNQSEFGLYSFEYIIESKGVIEVSVFTTYRTKQYSIFGGLVFSDFFDDQDDTTVLTTLPPTLIIKNLFSKLKVLDWFAAIVKAFNLVLVPQDDGTIYVNTLNSWYNSGNILEVSEYVDIESLEVARGKIYNEVNFGYEEQESFLSEEYESQFGQQFGGFRDQISGVSSEDKLEITLPFENPQFERLLPSQNQYGFIVDNSLSSYNNKPFLLYIPTLSVSTDSLIGFSGDTYESISSINTPSHSIFMEGGFSAQFNAEYSEYNGNELLDNFYNRNYNDYLTDIFNTQRRQFTLNINFPISISSNLGLNDRLIIKGDRYVIDNIETNLLTGLSKVVLLNDIFTSLSTGDISKVSQTFVTAKSAGSSYYIGAKSAQVNTESTFITLEKEFITSGENINFNLTDNNTGVERIALIQIFDGLKNPTIIVLQNKTKFISFANKTILWGSTTVTFND
tara:strand:+ start:5108 stop:7414 length:2307 start_codon:yes stop_codon:yes gene_type:complete